MRMPEFCPRHHKPEEKKETYSHAVRDGDQVVCVTYECGCTVTWKRAEIWASR